MLMFLLLGNAVDLDVDQGCVNAAQGFDLMVFQFCEDVLCGGSFQIVILGSCGPLVREG